MLSDRRSSSIYRVVTGCLFVLAGSSKLIAPERTAALIASHHVPGSRMLAFALATFEVVGGSLLIVNWQARRVAIGLGAFVLVAATMIHLPVAFSGPGALDFAFDVCVLVLLYGIAAPRARASKPT